MSKPVAEFSSLKEACKWLIEPFFAYANTHPAKEIVFMWKDPEVADRVELIYKKCIKCGKERLSNEDLSSPSRMRMSTYSRHCHSCNEQFVMTAASVTRAAEKEGFVTFCEVFDERVNRYEKKLEHKSL